MAINLRNPITVSAVAQKVYDKALIQQKTTVQLTVGGPIQFSCTIVPYISATGELAPVDRYIRLNVPDITSLITGNSTYASAIAAEEAAIQAVAQNLGLM